MQTNFIKLCDKQSNFLPASKIKPKYKKQSSSIYTGSLT